MGERVALGPRAVNARLRTHLREALERKVDAHGLVVWDDPAREYGPEAAAAVCPDDTAFMPFEGSWYELRRAIEGQLAGESPPRLLIYIPADGVAEDPLAEVRDAGSSFKLRLETLLRQALIGELTDARLAELGRSARTMIEAEAALEDGAAVGDVRLVSLLGSADAIQMALAVLASERDDEIAAERAWGEVTDFFTRTIGGKLSGEGDDLRLAVTRHLLLCELHEKLDGLPAELQAGFAEPQREQLRRAIAIADAWRRDRHRVGAYARLATSADRDLSLERTLSWEPALAAVDAAPGIERLALREAVRELATEELASARRLARDRLDASLWSRLPLEGAPGAEVWGARWRVVEAVAALRERVNALAIPGGDAAQLLGWYSQEGRDVDRAHRRLELALTELDVEEDLEEGIGVARSAYEEWLDRLLQRFTAAAAAEGIEPGSLVSQSRVHRQYVRNREEPVAYIWVDALRYELGVDLAEKLRPTCARVELHPAIALAPTITPVGMAALCPDAENGVELDMKASGKLSVRVAGSEVLDVPARVERLRAAHGTVVDIQLSDLVSRGEREIAGIINGASLVLVRSQEIDAAGETGMLATSWDAFDSTVQQLVRAVARLGQAGVRRVVISADHGFVALSRGLRPDRLVDGPSGGAGARHARAWIGRGGTTTPATVRVPLASAGVAGDLDLIVPAHLAVFRGPWTRQFFHGGLSPEELVVPVIVAETQRLPDSAGRSVDIEVAGRRLTTGAFSTTLTFQPDLFSSDAKIRLEARRRGRKDPSARVVSGDGHDPETGTVHLADAPAVLTCRVTENLARGEEVELLAFDARTDQLLGRTTVPVAAAINVEEELS